MISERDVVLRTYELLCTDGEEVDLPKKIVDTFGSVRIQKGYMGVQRVNLLKIRETLWMVGMGCVGDYAYDIFALHCYGRNYEKTVPRQICSLNDSGDRQNFSVLFMSKDGSVCVGRAYKELFFDVDPHIIGNKESLFYKSDFPHFLSKKIRDTLVSRSQKEG